MSDYHLIHFGKINIKKVEEYYDTSIALNGHNLDLDLNFDKTSFEKNLFDRIQHLLENIGTYDQQHKKRIKAEFDEGGTIKEFVDFHAEELDKKVLGALIDINNTQIPFNIQLLDQLQLNRVGLYPDGVFDAEYFAVFDYSFIGNEFEEQSDGIRRKKITDQILAVKTDDKGNVLAIDWES